MLFIQLMWHGFPAIRNTFLRYNQNTFYYTHAERYWLCCPWFTQVLIADCAKAITNGCRQVFPHIIRVYCWAHVIRNVDKKLDSLVRNTCMRSEIRRDIKILQLAKSDPEFHRASELWFKKWNTTDTSAFATYFMDEYITKHMEWHEAITASKQQTM